MRKDDQRVFDYIWLTNERMMAFAVKTRNRGNTEYQSGIIIAGSTRGGGQDFAPAGEDERD